MKTVITSNFYKQKKFYEKFFQTCGKKMGEKYSANIKKKTLNKF